MKSSHTILQCLIEIEAVEKVYLHRHTDGKYIKQKSLVRLEISLNGELKFMGFGCSMQIRSEREATRLEITSPCVKINQTNFLSLLSPPTSPIFPYSTKLDVNYNGKMS